MNQMDRIKQSRRSRRRRRNRQLAMYGMLVLFGGICVSAAWLNLSVRESRKMAGYTAEKKLLKQPWTMTVSYDGKTAPVEDILTPEITRMLDTIYEGDREKTGEYQIDLASLKASARAFAESFAV